MEYNEVVQLIGQLGFPMFVAIWYMVKQSQDTRQMSETLTKLTEAINSMKEYQK